MQILKPNIIITNQRCVLIFKVRVGVSHHDVDFANGTIGVKNALAFVLDKKSAGNENNGDGDEEPKKKKRKKGGKTENKKDKNKSKKEKAKAGHTN